MLKLRDWGPGLVLDDVVGDVEALSPTAVAGTVGALVGQEAQLAFARRDGATEAGGDLFKPSAVAELDAEADLDAGGPARPALQGEGRFLARQLGDAVDHAQMHHLLAALVSGLAQVPGDELQLEPLGEHVEEELQVFEGPLAAAGAGPLLGSAGARRGGDAVVEQEVYAGQPCLGPAVGGLGCEGDRGRSIGRNRRPGLHIPP